MLRTGSASKKALLTHPNLWFGLAVALAILLGCALFVVPVTTIIPALLALLIVGLLAFQPLWSITLGMVFLPVTFYGVAMPLLSGLVGWASAGQSRISLRTNMDWWIIPLGCIFLYKSIFTLSSLPNNAYVSQWILTFSLFYLLVYLMRTQKLTPRYVLEATVWGLMFQAGLSIVQVATGLGYPVGKLPHNERNYFAFLGFGEKYSLQAMGTFKHFAQLGNYVAMYANLYFPFVLYMLPKFSVKGVLPYALLLVTILITYSRGALGAIVLSLAYFAYLFPNKPAKTLELVRAGVWAVVGVAIYLLLFKDYGSSLNPRDDIWSVTFYYFERNPEHFWWGEGFNALWDTLLNYAPAHTPWDMISAFGPHNLVLFFIHAVGLPVTCFLLLGLAVMTGQTFIECASLMRHGYMVRYKLPGQFFNTHNPYQRLTKHYDDWTRAQWAWWCLNAGFHLMLLAVFISGANDHVFQDPRFLASVFLVAAIRYGVPWKTHAHVWQTAFPNTPATVEAA
jgi:hypothetical protein